MTRTVDFYFDYSCPYAYIASTRIEGVAARSGARLNLRPVLLGGILKELNGATNPIDEMSPPKARHNVLDMHRWAAVRHVPFSYHPRHPLRTLRALRATLAAGEPFGPLMHAFFKAYWVDNRDLDDREVVAEILRERRLDARAVLARAESADIKSDLRARTDEAIEKGLFGVPAMIVEGNLYWGQDRLDEVEEALGEDESTVLMPGLQLSSEERAVDLWFDYSSPYSYIAAVRAPRVFRSSLRWRPMLLGAVFKALGGPMIPLHAMSASKRRYAERDMRRQAIEGGVRLNWPSRFPLNTVTSLRVTLAVAADPALADRLTPLIQRFYRAMWVEDRDPQDADTVRAVCSDVGLDGFDLLERASSPEGKQALRDATDEAVRLGVFGAPTWAVHSTGRPPGLFWGNDRLELAMRASGGDDRVLDAGRET